MAFQQPLYYHGEVVIYQDQSLGIGAYGKVCKAKCGQLPCAAKLLHDTLFQHNDPGENVLSSKFEQECRFLSTIQHPNIVQYLATTRDPATGRAVLLMELMDESLTKHLERSVTPLPCHIQVDICHDIALALSYLHSNGIIHRDLSSNNVLLIAGKRAKVTDFGMSKLIDAYPQMTPLTQAPGTQNYMPPEALITPPRYKHKLDCFSYGVLALQIASGIYPTPRDAMRYENNPHYQTGRVIVPVPERERRANDIDQVDPLNPLRPIALDCIRDRDEERPSACHLCGRVAKLKEEHAYRESLEAGAGNSQKYYIELQRVSQGKSALQRELVMTKESRQQLLGELNSEKQSYQALAREADRKLDIAEREAEVKLRRMEQQVADIRGSDGERVRKLERRNQGLADLLTEVRRKLAISEQQLLESRERERKLQDQLYTESREKERDLQQRLYAVEQEYRGRDLQRIHTQQTALGYKEHEVQKLRKKVKEYEGIVLDFQVMDIDKEQQAALHHFEIQRTQSSPAIQPAPTPVPKPNLELAPPIPEWREAKPPPEEMTGYTGQVTVHEGTAYFTQNFVVYTYMESRDKWEELPRCDNKNFGVAVINGQFTAIGGLDRNNVHSDDVLTLKERERRWEKLLPAMPTARVHPATVTTPTHLVVAGGTYVSQDPNRSSKGYAVVEVMALKTFLWSAVSSLPEVVRYPQIKHTANHLLLSDTEKNSVYTCSVEGLVQSQQADMVWTRKANIPVLQGASLVAMDGQVLALGGLDMAGTPQDSVYCYKIAEDAWEMVKALHTPRSWVLSVLCRDSVLVVVGGFEDNWNLCGRTEKITIKL